MDRTSARAAAMKLLYEWDMGGDGGDDTRIGMLEIAPDENESEYMERIVSGVMAKKDELDARIAKHCVDWSIDRITKVDLAILRVAAFEITEKTVPGGVAVNEAVELSREYSSEKAGGFINGVLGSLIRAEDRT